MSFYPETDRASTWVALVMIGFMAVSVLVWVWGRSPRGAEESAATKASRAAAESAPAEAAQKPDAPQPPQTAALPAAAQASALPPALNTRPADAPAPQFAQASQTSPAPARQSPAAPSEPAWMNPRPEPQQPVQVASAPAPTPAPVRPAPTPAPPQARPPADEGGLSASGLVRGLRARGHRVHAAVSGDSRSMTLSVSGSTLTRDACVEWLSGSRQELKSAGVRVVVANNGQGSWTFML